VAGESKNLGRDQPTIDYLCYIEDVNDHVGLREMRQEASDLVRRVEAGEEIVVTVSGRPAAMLVPVRRMRWRNSLDIGYVFDNPADQAWLAEHSARSDVVGDDPQDPWSEQA
jgi:prevent-host-death family protein